MGSLSECGPVGRSRSANGGGVWVCAVVVVIVVVVLGFMCVGGLCLKMWMSPLCGSVWERGEVGGSPAAYTA